jgi:gliding motility-associated protein GldM
MAGGNLSPRQKMINMMYLVLTALLALNISKDILDALTRLNASLDETVQTVNAKNADIYSAFQRAMADNPEKTKEWNDKAMAVKKASDDLNTHIAELKHSLIEVSGGYAEGFEKGSDMAKSMDAREKPAAYLLVEGHAKTLKGKIDSYKNAVSATVDDPKIKSSIASVFSTADQEVGEDKIKTSWENASFEHFPLAAILPFLTDYQAKIRNTESEVISKLKTNITASDVTFTGIAPMVMPKSNYITSGDEYQAQVFLAAYDDTQEPEIFINGEPLAKEDIVNGRGTVRFSTNSVGEQKWGGKIVVKQINKDPITYDIPEQTYTVAPPSVVISPTKMNVLYRGVQNPLDIGVPGVDPSKIVVNSPYVRQVKPGEYMANVSNARGIKTIKIGVSVKETDKDGNVTTRNAGQKEFRIKGLPPAIGSILNRNEGQLSKGLIKAKPVEAKYEDFPFDLPLTVTSFEVVVPGSPPEKIRGNKMTGIIKTKIDRMKPGETITIRNIKAVAPGGVKIPKVAAISLDVN